MKQENENATLSERLLPVLEEPGEELPVQISFEIIRLFSEGLYQSPHKAIEELVSNGYDAGATRVFVITPNHIVVEIDEDTGTEASVGENDGDEGPDFGSSASGATDREDDAKDDDEDIRESLWVIDDGIGMDEDGFRRLWLVAESTKVADQEVRGRKPIGQFGIGKLAAYVLARRLTHISKKDGKYFFTSMDFRQVEGKRQNDKDAPPVTIALHEIDEDTAKSLMVEVDGRNDDAWAMLFGPDASESWTAAAMTDFKGLFGKFRPGTLRWVLRTGLPAVTDFSIYLNKEALKSSKEDAEPLLELPIGTDGDEQATKIGLRVDKDGVHIPGISGGITGSARLYEKPISKGKSLQYGRSNGFFVRVRGRVINLEDELFGMEALNHAVWSRFILEIDADGLREHLLSSREGVRESEPIYALRDYLRAKFNACRSAFETENKLSLVGLDIKLLLQNASSSVLAEPLVEAVRQSLAELRQPSHYISVPTDIPVEDREEWLEEFENTLVSGPFEDLAFAQVGPYDRLVEYDAANRRLIVNEEHPFIAKMLSHSKNQTPATIFATSEIITDALLRELGISPALTGELFSARDRALRQIAGDYGPDPADVLRHLAVADMDKDALEKAVGEAFITLGFRYDRRGGNKGGPDGVLDARMGLGSTNELEDFRIVYDAKTTTSNSVSVGKVDFGALWDFRVTENADHAFIIAKAFAGQDDPESAVNRRTAQGREDRPMSVVTTAQLRRLVELHYQCGLTLRQVRGLFQEALTVTEVTEYLRSLEAALSEDQPPVPIDRLIHGLEREKEDVYSRPNVAAVRTKDEVLKAYEPERLVAALKAVQTIIGARWLEVSDTSFEVIMSHTAEQILDELDRRSQGEVRFHRTPELGQS